MSGLQPDLRSHLYARCLNRRAACAMLRPMPNLRRLFRYVLPYWPQMVAATVALLCSSLIILALPWAVSQLVDIVFAAGDAQLLNRLAAGLLGLFVVQSIFFFVEAYYLERVGQRRELLLEFAAQLVPPLV